MGWGSGSDLMSSVVQGLRERGVPDEQRKVFYEVLFPAMMDLDWDTESDCVGDDPVLDEVMGYEVKFACPECGYVHCSLEGLTTCYNSCFCIECDTETYLGDGVPADLCGECQGCLFAKSEGLWNFSQKNHAEFQSKFRGE